MGGNSQQVEKEKILHLEAYLQERPLITKQYAIIAGAGDLQTSSTRAASNHISSLAVNLCFGYEGFLALRSSPRVL